VRGSASAATGLVSLSEIGEADVRLPARPNIEASPSIGSEFRITRQRRPKATKSTKSVASCLHANGHVRPWRIHARAADGYSLPDGTLCCAMRTCGDATSAGTVRKTK
jgi:hypothetical protein